MRPLITVAISAMLLGSALPVAASAAPFDTYELIMWQERTPAQLAGLARLGFTGTKLRATGGTVDPAELAIHVASGLPWFLENVATDFYAPYHRYTPGKSVTWLFDAAKAHRRRDPADTSVFLRDPSLSDPVWQTRIADRLAGLVAAQSRYRPLYYNLADEAGIGDLSAAWDADISPVSLAAFREWLHTQYPSLGAVNAEWGTDYATWDAVQPMLTDAALARTDGNYAAWSDFKQFMDGAFAGAVRAGTDALHRADSSARAGLEGGQLPGWGGYDYFQLAPAVDVLEIYDEANNVAIARAASPDTIILRTSFVPGDGAEAWRSLLQGGRGTVVWDDGDQVVHPDGSPAPRGAELALLIDAMRTVAPAILASQPDRDPVAVLVSQSSFRVQWLLDRRNGAPWSDRDSGREYEDNAWRAGRRETLQILSALGVQPHLLSSAMLEAGALARDGIRVLFLPDALSLSDAEIVAIRAFAAAGGTVLADTEPGLFDGHGRRRDASSLADIAKVSEAVMRRGGVADTPRLDAVAALLTAAGASPRAEFRAPNGSRAAGLEARWFRHDGGLILSLQAAAPYAAADRVTIGMPGLADIHDMRTPGPVITGAISLAPADPSILRLTGPTPTGR